MDPEADRVDPDGDRVDLEGDRMDPEGDRGDPDRDRVDPEGDRVDPDRDRVDPEGDRVDSEGDRMDPEGDRMDPEGDRVDPKGNRGDSEGERVDPEGDRSDPNGDCGDSEGHRVDPEGNRSDPKGDRVNPEAHRVNPEGHRVDPEGDRADVPSDFGEDGRNLATLASPSPGVARDLLLLRMDPTHRFSDRAAAYAAARPTYGDDVAHFVLHGLGPDPRVADLGAGTGISSRLLASHGARVFAVEPNAAMRERATETAGVTWVNGTGEQTTLEDASVDAVTAFQAFHWFANDAALAEIQRIVRPGGTAALVLNERDPSDPFTANYGDLVRRYAEDDTEQRRLDSMAIFARLPGNVERRTFPNEQRLDRSGLLARTRSTSYLPKAGPRSEALEGEVGALFDRSATDGQVRLALATFVIAVKFTPQLG